MTHQADEIRRMADKLQREIDTGDWPTCRDTAYAAAAMLREYAEVVEVDDAMVERAHNAYWNYVHDEPTNQHKIDRDSMRAALTDALSGREGDGNG